MGGGLSTGSSRDREHNSDDVIETGKVNDVLFDDAPFWHEFKEGVGKEFYEKPPTLRLLRQSQESFTKQNFTIPTWNGVKIPYPTPTDRRYLLKDVDFTMIDDHVLQTGSDLLQIDLEDIVTYLLKPTRNDLEKVRAIFAWITTQNLDNLDVKCESSEDKGDKIAIKRAKSEGKGDKMEIKDVGPVDKVDKENSGAFYLVQIKTGEIGYAQLFEKMCKYALIPSYSIRGWVKGAGYEPGDMLRKPKAMWSAVLFGGSWRLLDCHWSAWKAVGTKRKDWEAVGDAGERKQTRGQVNMELIKERQYQEAFFLTDPEVMIHSHLPVDDRWQLLARTVTKEEFRLLSFLKPAFFDLGFQVVETTSVIQAQEGKGSVSIRIPNGGSHRFFCRLFHSLDKSGNTNTFGKLKLERFVFLNVNRKVGLVTVGFDLPATGKYKLELFCEEIDKKRGVYELISAYAIHCDRLAKTKPEPYPVNSRIEWGPGVDTERLGISALSHPSGLVVSKRGQAEIHFRVKQQMEFRHKLVRGESNVTTYDEYAFYEFRKDVVIYHIRLPEKGKFALKLYARRKDAVMEDFPNICNYLLENERICMWLASFPEAITRGCAGPTIDFSKLGMKCLTGDKAYVETNSGERNLKLQCSQNVLLVPKLFILKGNNMVDHSEYIKFKSKRDTKTFYSVFPESGLYYFKLLGGRGSDQPIYHSLIQARLPKVGSLPFPKVLDDWNPSFEVLKPTYGYLPTDEIVPFLADIPEATRVSLTTAPPTELTRNKQGLWDGRLPTGNKETEVDLMASFKSGKTHAILFTYKIVSPSTIEKIIQKQKKDYDRELARLRKEGLVDENEVAIHESDNSKKDERIRQRLISATKSQDESALRKAVKEFLDAGLREKENDLTEARIVLDVIQIRAELDTAFSTNDIDALKRIIEKIERKKLERRLEPQLAKAREAVCTESHLTKAKKAVINMEAKTMTEIRSYNRPPQAVYDVMRAALLLLGEREDRVVDWNDCRRLCNPVGSKGLKRRVEVLDVEQLSPAAVQCARKLLAKTSPDSVGQISAGAAAFHTWALGMIEEADKASPVQGDGS
ncbi:uncharacterized protein LOC135473466 [Liolophura sinensis]|uniref:uncharacterized protein LOC135473466 n=1 Tax=Liolophura sinensis TaxID=3198878 RepID=UPI0031590AA8